MFGLFKKKNSVSQTSHASSLSIDGRKFVPIAIENNFLEIHPFRKMEMERMDQIEQDIFQIFSSNRTTKYTSNHKVNSLKDATDKVFNMVIGCQRKTYFAHFITEKSTNRVIGFINIISPEQAKKSYKMQEYNWMLEYFLNERYCGNGIMSGAIKAVSQKMKTQGIDKIGAVCDKENTASIKLLQKCGFSRKEAFDFKQDYYEL